MTDVEREGEREEVRRNGKRGRKGGRQKDRVWKVKRERERGQMMIV